MVEVLKFSGDFDSLIETDKEMLRDFFMNFYSKAKMKLSNEISLEFVIKNYKEFGKSKKYTINFRLIAPTNILRVSATEWDLKKVIHKASDKMLNEIEGKFHVSNQHG
ncbi:hypothetical protein KAS08_00035 [Candidatus Pacearchaeota archaeon]|nr:hypothetical protein [Candidatus Pacearchaeota archaeon]